MMATDNLTLAELRRRLQNRAEQPPAAAPIAAASVPVFLRAARDAPAGAAHQPRGSAVAWMAASVLLTAAAGWFGSILPWDVWLKLVGPATAVDTSQLQAPPPPVAVTNLAKLDFSPAGLLRPATAALEAKAPSAALAYTAAPAPSPPDVALTAFEIADAAGREDTGVPLGIRIEPSGTAVPVKLSGVPAGARLSAGQAAADGAWLVPAGAHERLRLLPPPDFNGAFWLTASVDDPATATILRRDIQVSIAPVADPPELAVAYRLLPGEAALVLDIEAASVARGEAVTIALSGLPAGATVSAGQEGPNGWTLSAAAAKGAILRDIPDLPGDLTIRVSAIATDGESQAVVERDVLIPAADLAKLRLPPALSSSAAALLERGDGFMARADPASARLFYELAAAEGSGTAATAVGRSFDPLVFQDLGLRHVVANPDKALFWYGRGVAAKDPAAANLQRELKAWLAQTQE